MSQGSHYNIVIVGGGSSGVTVAAELEAKHCQGSIAVIEPSDIHTYQPALTLVGAGVTPLKAIRRPTRELLPADVTLIPQAAATFTPESNSLTLADGTSVSYDWLILCPGLELKWDAVAGLKDTIGKNGVCSNYSPATAPYTQECVESIRHGQTALFTMAPMPIKCPGAPQKAAYLAADLFRKKGILHAVDVKYLTATPSIFGVPFFAKQLNKVAARYGIDVRLQHVLTAVNGANKTATFSRPDGQDPVTLPFDMIHVTPPQGPIAAFANSPFADEAGWVDVDKNTLKSTKFANVWGLGDGTSTPNSKTAAAVRKQAPVVVDQILAAMKGTDSTAAYDGYASCPLTTAYGKVIMAEFRYGGEVTPTLPLDPGKERWVNWWIKTTGLPLMYWYYMLKGRVAFPGHDVDYGKRKGING